MFTKETILNKIFSALLILLGASTLLISNDATAFVFTLMIAVPLFFTKTNMIG